MIFFFFLSSWHQNHETIMNFEIFSFLLSFLECKETEPLLLALVDS